MCTKTVGPIKLIPTAALATPAYQPASGWMPAMGFGSVKALIQLGGLGGNFTCAPAYQTAATDTESPDAWATIEASPTYLDTAGTKDCTATTDLSSAIAGKFYIRFGVAVKNSSGTSLSRGNVTLAVTGKA